MKQTARKFSIVRFAPRGEESFIETVTSRVKEYLADNSISPYANTAMWVKTAAMLALYFAPYAVIVTGLASSSLWLFFGMWFVMGWGVSGIGTSVMHDANHGTYSPNKRVNQAIGSILEMIGGYAANWRIQHNILHHTYTNISGLDEDIDTMGLIRLSPNQPRKKFQRFQHLYAWFFYMIMTLYWMTAKDYLGVFRYHKLGLLSKQRVSLATALTKITLAKIFYYGYIIVLPILFSGVAWYYVVGGFLLMHFVAGLFLSCVFQPAHIMESSSFPMPALKSGKATIEETWAVHEVITTTNFAPNNRLLSWFIGGLNFQIEHHLFTDICHVHYKKIAPIVQETAEEFGIPYQVQPTFTKALIEHARMLKKLGRGEV